MNRWGVIRLGNALRGAGLSVSIQDLAEASLCLGRYPEIPPEILLRSILIHRPQDISIFNFVWNALTLDYPYAQRNKDVFSERAQSPYGSGGQHSSQGSGSLGKVLSVQGLASFKYVPSDLGSGEDVLEFEQKVKQALGHLEYYIWINSVDLAYQKGELTESDHFTLHQQGSELQNAVRQYLMAKQIEAENSWQPLKNQYWRHKPLQTLSSEEKNMVQTALRQLSKKLAVRPGLRWRMSSGGRLDFALTVKRSCQQDGYIFHLLHHRPLPRLPELILLCDVSNSVAPYSEFLLYLVGRLHTRFHRVRLFFFIDSIWDVGANIWDQDMDELKDEIESWGRYSTSGFSDYGQVFKEFAGDVLPEISCQATILILGDGKNNFRLPQEEYLAQIRDHVRHIYWLNPLNEKEWSERDNALAVYRPFCTQVYRCRTLNDLQEIARILV